LLRIRFEDIPSCAAFSPDGRSILVGVDPLAARRQNDCLFLWDLAANRKTRSLPAHYAVSAAGFSEDGAQAISCGASGFDVWDLRAGKLLPNARSVTQPTMADATLLPGARQALTLSPDSTLTLWNLEDGSATRCSTTGSVGFSADRRSPPALVMLTNCRSCIVAARGSVKQVEIPTLKEAFSLSISPSSISFGVPIFAGRLWLANEEEESLSIWSLQTGRKIRTLTPALMGTAAVSADGMQALYLSRSDYSAKWDHHLLCLDFSRPRQFRRFESRLSHAGELLPQDPQSPEAMAILGEWYTYRGLWDWGAELLQAARGSGAKVPALDLARCLWKTGQTEAARQEFNEAMRQREAPDYYLKLCLNALSNAPSAALRPRS
jgi:hypothetical protein